MVQLIRRKANGEGLGSRYNNHRPSVESNASIDGGPTLEADAQGTNLHERHEGGMRHGGESRNHQKLKEQALQGEFKVKGRCIETTNRTRKC